jgi:hypothetical protein
MSPATLVKHQYPTNPVRDAKDLRRFSGDMPPVAGIHFYSPSCVPVIGRGLTRVTAGRHVPTAHAMVRATVGLPHKT